jgi:hypothetical protein
MNAATIQKCRQCNVSITMLLTRRPHHAPRRAADPIPYVSRPATAFAVAAASVNSARAKKARRPGSPCSANTRT